MASIPRYYIGICSRSLQLVSLLTKLYTQLCHNMVVHFVWHGFTLALTHVAFVSSLCQVLQITLAASYIDSSLWLLDPHYRRPNIMTAILLPSLFFPHGYVETFGITPPSDRLGMIIRPSFCLTTLFCLLYSAGMYCISTGLPCIAVSFLSLKGQRAPFALNIYFLLSKSFFTPRLQPREGKCENTYFFCYPPPVIFPLPQIHLQRKK